MGWYRAREFGFDPRVCRGVHVGGCVAGRRWPRSSDWDVEAHAHNRDFDPWSGWICVASERSLFTGSRRPTRIMVHEYAHLLAPNSRHGAAWQEAVTDLGYPSEAEWFRPARPARATRASQVSASRPGRALSAARKVARRKKPPGRGRAA